MRAITFIDVEELELATVDDAAIVDRGDVIVEVDVAGICGSDLHPYLGRERGLDRGTIMGHEFVGRVVDAGPGVLGLSAGDRVVAPFTASCGACAACEGGLTSRCERGQLFGWVEDGRGLNGAQAELVRVPLADATLVRIPESLADDAVALLAGDVLATAMFAVELARVAPGELVAVIGCGPVGLLAVLAALARGARRVFALDAVASRLALARGFGAVVVDITNGDAGARVREQTDGRGVDRVIEAVGSPEATRTAADLARPGATIAAIGVHTEARLALAPGELYDRNLTYAAGRCPARRILPDALHFAGENEAAIAEMITHRLPLADGIEAYRRLAAREQGWGKVVLEVGRRSHDAGGVPVAASFGIP